MLLSSAAQGLAGSADGVPWHAWLQAGLFGVLAAILGALLLVLLEVRKLARELGMFAQAARDRTKPLVDHATNAARNLDQVCRVAREGADRLEGSFSRVADEADKAAGHARARLQDLAALVDLAQAEAEDAVLDVATKVRMARRGAGLAQWIGRGGKKPAGEDVADDAPEQAPAGTSGGTQLAGEDEPDDAPEQAPVGTSGGKIPAGGDEREPGRSDEAPRPEPAGHVRGSLPGSARTRPSVPASQPEGGGGETIADDERRAVPELANPS